MPSKTDENPKTYRQYSMQTLVFRMALFEGFPNIPTYPPVRDTQWAQIRQQ